MRTYVEKLRDPRWQKKRLEILSRDDWQCSMCLERTKELQVDHKGYVAGLEPWEHADENLWTLCAACHNQITALRKEAKALIDSAANFHQLWNVLGFLKAAVFWADGVKLSQDEARGYAIGCLPVAVTTDDVAQEIEDGYLSEEAVLRLRHNYPGSKGGK